MLEQLLSMVANIEEKNPNRLYGWRIRRYVETAIRLLSNPADLDWTEDILNVPAPITIDRAWRGFALKCDEYVAENDVDPAIINGVLHHIARFMAFRCGSGESIYTCGYSRVLCSSSAGLIRAEEGFVSLSMLLRRLGYEQEALSA